MGRRDHVEVSDNGKYLCQTGSISPVGAQGWSVITLLQANQVASVIIARSGSWMSAMSLQKLLYYCQAWHLAVTDEPLFSERIKAWKDGPVVPQVWAVRKEPETRRASAQDPVALDAETSDLIDLVLRAYGSMSGDELSALTHAELPWSDSRAGLEVDAPSSTAISNESMAAFYRAHRKLAGRTAADLAAGGIHLRRSHEDASHDEFDADAFLATLGPEYDDPGPDPFGGGNLEPGDKADDGADQGPRRAYLSN